MTAEGSEPLPPLFNYGQPKSTTTTRVTSLTDEIVVEGDEESSGDDAAVDEIGDMPIALQAKLLRALQSGEVTPVGGRDPLTDHRSPNVDGARIVFYA